MGRGRRILGDGKGDLGMSCELVNSILIGILLGIIVVGLVIGLSWIFNGN